MLHSIKDLTCNGYKPSTLLLPIDIVQRARLIIKKTSINTTPRKMRFGERLRLGHSPGALFRHCDRCFTKLKACGKTRNPSP